MSCRSFILKDNPWLTALIQTKGAQGQLQRGLGAGLGTAVGFPWISQISYITKSAFFGKWADDSGISLCCCHRCHDNTLQTRQLWYDNIKVWKPEPWIKLELATDFLWHQWGEGHWKNKHALLSTYAKPCHMWPDWHLTCPYIDATTFHGQMLINTSAGLHVGEIVHIGRT